jgi:phycoerythrobilin:ferredoxin oxidoreductase
MSSNNDENDCYQKKQVSDGIYRPFLEYAWGKLENSSLVNTNANEDDVIYNSSPAKGGHNVEGTMVNVEIRSLHGRTSKTTPCSPLRLARYALLETSMPKNDNDTNEMISQNNGIHVLNLVLFPSAEAPPMPILGMDLVTLPGGKHLIAIDFQPVLPRPSSSSSSSSSSSPTTSQADNERNDEESVFFMSQKYTKYERQLKEIHEEYFLSKQNVLPWGGDIPAPADRFFSPFALWTRLSSKNKNNDDDDDDDGDDANMEPVYIIEHDIYHAFCAYFDLYLELLLDVQNEILQKATTMKGEESIHENEEDDYDTKINAEKLREGHRDYLAYRSGNDPARPMLTRLYGDEWTEEVIANTLFKMI